MRLQGVLVGIAFQNAIELRVGPGSVEGVEQIAGLICPDIRGQFRKNGLKLFVLTLSDPLTSR